MLKRAQLIHMVYTPLLFHQAWREKVGQIRQPRQNRPYQSSPVLEAISIAWTIFTQIIEIPYFPAIKAQFGSECFEQNQHHDQFHAIFSRWNGI